MVGAPIALCLSLGRSLRLPLHVAAIGAAGFIASQLVHLPLNAALGLSGGAGPLTSAPLAVVALAFGLSAGLCEELARYACMSLLLRRRLGWQTGLLYGAGHGGVESLLFGLAATANTLVMSVLPAFPSLAGRPDVQAAAWSLSTHAWFEPIFAGVERLAAMSAHMGLSLLVMRAVTRRNPAWLAAAIAGHALLDAPLLPLQLAHVNAAWIELLVLVAGGLLLAAGWSLRGPAVSHQPSG